MVWADGRGNSPSDPMYPKKRDIIPVKVEDRKDRRDELWQNSLVEQELDDIDRINRWLKPDPDNKGVIRLPNKDNWFRHITYKSIVLTEPLPAGSGLVNTRSFIEKMMDHGRKQTQEFLKERQSDFEKDG